MVEGYQQLVKSENMMIKTNWEKEGNLRYHAERYIAFWFLWKLVSQQRLIEKHSASFSTQHVDLFEGQSLPRWRQMLHNQLKNLDRKLKIKTSLVLFVIVPPGSFSFEEEAVALEEFDDDVLDEEYDWLE